MPVVIVANPKGGAGKSTLATNIAGYFAQKGHTVMLGDADRQQSSSLWLRLRPPQARPIVTWDATSADVLRPPRGTTHVVIDTPAGLHGKALKEAIKRADKLVIPLQPSLFDMQATRDFVDDLKERRRSDDLDIAVVGMRVDERTIAAERLREFMVELDLPVLTYLRDTQNYVRLAMAGLTIFDVVPNRVAKDRQAWSPITQWLEQ
jgi:chromosome partitioning protein